MQRIWAFSERIDTILNWTEGEWEIKRRMEMERMNEEQTERGGREGEREREYRIFIVYE